MTLNAVREHDACEREIAEEHEAEVLAWAAHLDDLWMSHQEAEMMMSIEMGEGFDEGDY